MRVDRPIKERVEETKLLAIRLTYKEHEMIKKAASTYSNGNVSQWIRYASTNFKPKTKDLNK